MLLIGLAAVTATVAKAPATYVVASAQGGETFTHQDPITEGLEGEA